MPIKIFEFEETLKQGRDVMCYAYSYDVEQATVKELKGFLATLLKHFPITIHADKSVTPYEESNDYMICWRHAHARIISLINEKKETCRYRWTSGIAIATLVVLSGTLYYDVHGSPNKSVQQVPKCTATESSAS